MQRKVKYRYSENCRSNTVNCRNSNTNNSSTDVPKKLMSTGRGKFVFPICGKIPAGEYYSTIKAAEFTKTRKGEDTLVVYYEIQNGVKLYNIVCNGYLPETQDEIYYVRQSYPDGKQPYAKFEDAMAEALNLKPYEGFTLDDIIGVTELVTLSYQKVDGIGGFEKRQPYTKEDFFNCQRYYEEHGDEFEDYIESDEDGESLGDYTDEYDEDIRDCEEGYEYDF